MTIRKKILFFSALALGFFLAAVFLVSRFALARGFARLERDQARDTVHHLRNAFENQQASLASVARDYAQWDGTYGVVQSNTTEFVASDITNETLKVLRVDFISIFNTSGIMVLYKSTEQDLPSADAMDLLETAEKKYLSADRSTPLNGVVNLGGKILMLSCQPVLPKHGESGPQGTLIMARELDQEVVSTISRSAGFPVWIEPTATLPVVDGREIAWSDGKTSAVIGSDSTMLYYVGLPDLSGKPAMLLAARTPRSLYLESKTETRYLWTLLTLAGIVYCGMLFWFVDHVLVARIDRLSNDISKVTVSGDLSVRLSAVGKDELSSLARTLNSMFAAIQKAKSELLQAQESLRFHAEHDALTGVLNRRAVRDVLRKELSRCRREQNTLGVILVDVDHFKKINDHKGHAAGDAVLVTVVQRITSMLRTYDTLGRYGGEEFLIVAPGCDLTVAQRLAERIRTIISDEPVDLGDGTINVTVSMGVTLGTAESDPEFLVAQADTAMYKAKRNGRNRFEVGLDLPEDEDEAIEIQPR